MEGAESVQGRQEIEAVPCFVLKTPTSHPQVLHTTQTPDAAQWQSPPGLGGEQVTYTRI